MPWSASRGPKKLQGVRVPDWIKADVSFAKACLRGLIQTDECIYTDRGYLMVSFTNTVEALADDVFSMLRGLGYTARKSEIHPKTDGTKYIVRVARQREVPLLLRELELFKE
jgi:hypothetical protein